MDELSEAELNRIREYIDREFRVEGELRKEINLNIKRPYRYRLLPGSAPQERIAGEGPAHAHQRPHPQGQAEDSGRSRTEARR